MKVGTILLVTLVLAACSSSSSKNPKTDGCTEDSCEAMSLSCGVILIGVPEVCLNARNGPSEYTVTGLCVEACKETGQGETVACYAAQLDRCETAHDNGTDPQPQPCGPSPEPKCASGCQEKYSDCNATCSNDWNTCLPCGKQCGLEKYRCVQACGG